MAHRSFVFLVIGTIMFLLCTGSSAQVPQMINYQGKLTTPAGALVNDTVQMVFSIYSDEGGTILLWTETQPAVEVLKGVFNVLLGSATKDGIPYSVFDGSTRYLGVKVGGDPEITPRKPMVSVAYAYRAGTASDNDWVYPSFAGGTNPRPYLYTYGPWGIARFGNVLYGNADSTHVNLGVACTTGTNGQNYKYCTVGGGWRNHAGGWYATVGGGYLNAASGEMATLGGGFDNIASGYAATVGGGAYNFATGYNATVGGGELNTAFGNVATVGGGRKNTANGDYSFAAGNYVIIGGAADYTFAFGNGFTTEASHAVVFHDASTPIKVGIQTTSPAYTLDVNGDARISGVIRGPAGGNGGLLQTRSGGNGFSVNWTDESELKFYIEDSHVKTFVIDHPLDKSKYLVHGTLEGAEAAVYYRGTAQLKNGIAEITLPSYFETLVRKEGRTILLTNIDGFDRLAVKKVDGEKIRDGRFVVFSDNPNSSQEFDWEVKAIRQDVPLLVVEPDKKDIEVRGDGPYTYPVSK
jgi:hypothetical protein